MNDLFTQLDILRAIRSRTDPRTIVDRARQPLMGAFPRLRALDLEQVTEVAPLVEHLTPRLSSAAPGARLWSGVEGKPFRIYTHVGDEPGRGQMLASVLQMPVFDMLERVAEEPMGVTPIALYPLIYTVEAFALATALDRCAAALPEEGHLEVVAADGVWLLGRATHEGFVPTPLELARGRYLARRQRSIAGLRAMDAPEAILAEASRAPSEVPADWFEAQQRFRHPDGRIWEITIGDKGVDIVGVDDDGDRFVRRIEGFDRWDAEALVASQTRDGFRPDP